MTFPMHNAFAHPHHDEAFKQPGSHTVIFLPNITPTYIPALKG